jgi:hypothetical protein
MAQQTAVEWLWNKIDNLIPYQDINKAQQFNGLLAQAKEMEKEQILNAFVSGSWLPACRTINSEQYYNQTYSDGEKK